MTDGQTTEGADITIERFYKDFQYKVPPQLPNISRGKRQNIKNLTPDGMSLNPKASWNKCIAHYT
jgi:hypothetical protein